MKAGNASPESGVPGTSDTGLPVHKTFAPMERLPCEALGWHWHFQEDVVAVGLFDSS
jgi:hypothetical protein